MPNHKNNDKKKVVTQRVSVHVVSYSCPNCGDEKDHIEFCDRCGKEMRVIDVVEKFGSEAQELIEKLKATIAARSASSNEEESPNIIILSEDDEEVVNGLDDDANTITDNEVAELDGIDELNDIFSDNDEDEGSSTTNQAIDIEDISAMLDEDDSNTSFEELDLDPDDLPTL